MTLRPALAKLSVIASACLALAATTACSDGAVVSVDAQIDGAADAPVPMPKAVSQVQWSGRGCTQAKCHDLIEPIRQPGSDMMKELKEVGDKHGDPDGCITCHGGNPTATTAKAAHTSSVPSLAKAGGPDDFFVDPGSPWVNARSCGQCHSELVKAQWQSLMMTEAGKIQGTAWAFGSLEGYSHLWGNYDASNPKDPHARLGTDAYRAYMIAKKEAHPNVFVDKHETVPEAPKTDADFAKLKDDPRQAMFTYLRTECQRCHLGVKGRPKRGDFRGMGCSACHVPYSNEGIYEGNDRHIPKILDKARGGHLLVHSIQGTRGAKLKAGKTSWTGIPVETCTTCHNRGKRIGVSYQGLMESAYGSPYTEGGGGQIALHTKKYIVMSKDVHYQKGMLCQDCHTSNDAHGDGFLGGTNLAGVEIECTDCHGTPKRYPWELPIGYGDEEEGKAPQVGPARGTSTKLPKYLHKGKVWPKQDGWILTARGNPMPEVVRVGNRVLLHTAGGKDLWLNPLKKLETTGQLSDEARTAMVQIDKHIDVMECYTCHSSWAPQCYGCHVKIDYSTGKKSFDWVAAGHEHKRPEYRTKKGELGLPPERTLIPGETSETRSFLRWENPPLGNNGEGRVTPLMPGCQVAATIIGRDGKELVRNQTFRTTPGTEGGGKKGQIGSDMSPVAPHTVGKSRTCESCHSSDKALGYGISGGGSGLTPQWDRETTVDLTTAQGKVIPGKARVQVERVKGLTRDWSAVLTKDGIQTQTVGHHFRGSGPLTAQQRMHMDRRFVCVGCHKQLPEGNLAVSALHHAAKMIGQVPRSREQHADLLSKMTWTSAWAQVGGGAVALMLLLGLALRRRRQGDD
ncbi:MAG: cytochrome C [Myxococcales bacterium]|nr:cytochrome C [Myxococcales bacterium]